MEHDCENIFLKPVKRSYKLVSRFTVIQKIYNTVLLTSPDVADSYYDQWYHAMVVIK
jgi:hypothetical protein